MSVILFHIIDIKYYNVYHKSRGIWCRLIVLFKTGRVSRLLV